MIRRHTRLHVSHKYDAMLIWVNDTRDYCVFYLIDVNDTYVSNHLHAREPLYSKVQSSRGGCSRRVHK